MKMKNADIYIRHPILGIQNVCVGYSIVIYDLVKSHKDGYNDYMCGVLVEKDDKLLLKDLRKTRVHYPVDTAPFIWKNRTRYYIRDFIRLTPEMQENMLEIIVS